MQTANLIRHAGRILSALLLLIGASAARAGHPEEKFDVLQTKSASFTNVTVTSKGRNSMLIMHSQGMTTVPYADLSPELQKQMAWTPVAAKSSKSRSSLNLKNVFASIQLPKNTTNKEVDAQLQRILQDRAALLIVLSAILLFYLFGSFCLMLICKKTGNEPGVLVWIPLLQIFPMLRAAGMSPAWFIVFLLPVANLLAQIIWSFKIVGARGKSVLVAVMLLIPILNFVAFLYLAFSSAGEPLPPIQAKPSGSSMVTLQTA